MLTRRRIQPTQDLEGLPRSVSMRIISLPEVTRGGNSRVALIEIAVFDRNLPDLLS